MANISSQGEAKSGGLSIPSRLVEFRDAEVERLSRPASDGSTLQREFEARLVALIEAAVTARARARQYLRVGRRFMGAARRARSQADLTRYEAHLREARLLHRQARRSLHFARLCERRVQSLAAIGGSDDRRR